MNNNIKEELLSIAEPEYMKFTSKLLPKSETILGVRIPKLRTIAKRIAKEDFRAYLKESTSDTFEEIMLQGLVIGYVKTDIEEIFEFISDFVPKITNWSVCDSFCAGLKITNKYKDDMWEFLQGYLHDDREFYIRFAVVMILDYYIDESYINTIFREFDEIVSEYYYVKMAVAWAISKCYVKFPEPTFSYLKDNKLDNFTYNKALQKIRESFMVDVNMKNEINQMRRK